MYSSGVAFRDARGTWVWLHTECLVVLQLGDRAATYRGVMNEPRLITPDHLPVMGLPGVVEALAELRRGGMVLVIDDKNRENGGDLILAAEKATPQSVAFMVRHTSGLLCVAMTDERADALGLPLMVARGDDPRGTAFTVSVDVKAGVTTGISAADRAATIRALGAAATRREDLSRPGHVFALRARPGGVFSRAGHTESAVDLCRLAGLADVGVLAEVVNRDGSMARQDQLEHFATAHGLVTVTVADIVRHRRRTEQMVQRMAQARIPTDYGEFSVITFRDFVDGGDHLALVRGDIGSLGREVGVQLPLVGVHSECVTGDVFGSRGCDCHQRLRAATSCIAEAGRGAVVYLRGQRDRGIGLSHPPGAYVFHDNGPHPHARAVRDLSGDGREYDVAAQILKDLGAFTVRLITDNATLLAGLGGSGIHVASREAVVAAPPWDNACRLPSERSRPKRTLAMKGSLGATSPA